MVPYSRACKHGTAGLTTGSYDEGAALMPTGAMPPAYLTVQRRMGIATMQEEQGTRESIGQRGRAIYGERLRALVETPENLGKEIVIDVDTGAYEIDAVGAAAARRLRERHPRVRCYGERIGYNAVYTLGGSIERTGR